MISSALPRYDGSRVSQIGEHAVTIGASMVGLLAGRVLADAFQEVTIIDRDTMPDEVVSRRSVPQADHVHVLLEPGRIILEDLFPGYSEELFSSGGLVIDVATDPKYYQQGDFLADGPNRLPMYCASRLLFEHVVPQRVAARNNITLRSGCQFTDYIVDGSTSRIEAVQITVAEDNLKRSRPTWSLTLLAGHLAHQSGLSAITTLLRLKRRSKLILGIARCVSSAQPRIVSSDRSGPMVTATTSLAGPSSTSWTPSSTV